MSLRTSGTAPATDDELMDQAVALARRMLEASLENETRRERRSRARLGAILGSRTGRELTFALTDEVLRIPHRRAAARRFAALVNRHGTDGFSRVDGFLLRTAAILAPRLSPVVMPLVVRRLIRESRGVVLPARDPALGRALRRQVAEGDRSNINALGEAILSDAEADDRFTRVMADAARPDVDYVSVKVSSILANLDELAFGDSVDRVQQRLGELLEACDTATPRTFLNIDMEEYRDLDLSVAAFTAVLDEHPSVDAGIVVQAYLPDSGPVARDLCVWAKKRHAAGGGRLKIRLVKGANLAMERVTAELHGWQQAPYTTKAEVDANYKAVLDDLLDPAWGDAVRVGLASHNLFDIAWAIVRSQALGASERVEFEMLEGMATAQRRQVRDNVGGLVIYSPVVRADEFDAALAYLTRRLDENTQPGNFLTDLFTLVPDGEAFRHQEQAFRGAVEDRLSIAGTRGRHPLVGATVGFGNEPDTDFTSAAARDAVDAAFAAPAAATPAVITKPVEVDRLLDGLASATVDSAPGDRSRGRSWLLAAANLMATERFTTIATLARHGAKTVREADAEVSEAIDFCRYYATEGSDLLDNASPSVEIGPRGPVAVLGPWNFPYAIPIGGVAGALAAGNPVVLKPAPETTAIGALIVDQFVRAGVPTDRLRLLVCPDGPVGRTLVEHPSIDTLVLTGAYATASLFLDWRPERRLLAETSGKNAMIITPAADLDLAIADLVASAFGHAGQKCSAASLAILVGSVGDDTRFTRRLADAVTSLRVGPADSLSTMVGPLIAPPEGKLRQALETDDGAWLVAPVEVGPSLWRPGVLNDVGPRAWFHTTECFGPVLGLMRAATLDEAIDLQNATPFGLTGGLHSLDPIEIDHWLERVDVGNAYVNRGTTGAVVRRQPFGGWKDSSVGGGAKPGGPHYVAQFTTLRDRASTNRLAAARDAYPRARDEWFRHEHDPSAMKAESNVLRYRPLTSVLLFVGDGADPTDVELVRLAAETAGASLFELDHSQVSKAREVLASAAVVRLRLLGAAPVEVLHAAHEAGVAVVTSRPVADGMLELIHWYSEQAVSRTRHRHGRLPS